MSRGRGARPDGRSKTQQFAMVTFEMAKREAWRTMPGPALKVLIELWARFNGSNNGDLSLSFREARHLLALSRRATAAAFASLQARGFITRTKDGSWYAKKASTWRLTMLKTANAGPTHDYRRWTKGADLTERRSAEHRVVISLEAARQRA